LSFEESEFLMDVVYIALGVGLFAVFGLYGAYLRTI
jgi:hypothetical protein